MIHDKAFALILDNENDFNLLLNVLANYPDKIIHENVGFQCSKNLYMNKVDGTMVKIGNCDANLSKENVLMILSVYVKAYFFGRKQGENDAKQFIKKWLNL